MKPIRLQRTIAVCSVLLFLCKMWAWHLTGSVSILTDALESTVNVITGFLGLYSVSLAAKPRDENHPYGHGKVEFISAAIEGALIFISGLLIVYEAIEHLLHPGKLQGLNIGILIIVGTGLVNFFLGTYAVASGKKNRSATVEAGGRHLRSDAYSTFILFAGLLALRLFPRLQWLDSAMALAFAVIIIVTGYKVVRSSLSGIMDEMDVSLLKDVIKLLQQHRQEQWVDIHNMRVMQYGEVLHIDAHMTLPWYYTVQQAEKEIYKISDLVKQQFGDKVELFIHLDACQEYQCKLCAMHDCAVRQHHFQSLLLWNEQNLWENHSHGNEPGEGDRATA